MLTKPNKYRCAKRAEIRLLSKNLSTTLLTPNLTICVYTAAQGRGRGHTLLRRGAAQARRYRRGRHVLLRPSQAACGLGSSAALPQGPSGRSQPVRAMVAAELDPHR